MDDSTPPAKTCRECGATLPATSEFFHRNVSSVDGLKGACKTCRCAGSASYKSAHAQRYRETARVRAKKKREARSPEKREAENAEKREYMRRYRREHHDEMIQRGRDWWAHNSERMSEQRRRRYRDDQDYRDKLLATQHLARKTATDEERARVCDLRRRQRRWFYENLRILKAAQGCSVCGRHDGRLDHHHIDPTTKRFNISRMYRTSLESFIDEIAKCTVLCASCHARLPKPATP